MTSATGNSYNSALLMMIGEQTYLEPLNFAIIRFWLLVGLVGGIGELHVIGVDGFWVLSERERSQDKEPTSAKSAVVGPHHA